MNFFKKKKVTKELAQKTVVTPEPIKLNGSDLDQNGSFVSDGGDHFPSPRFDLSFPPEALPDFPTRSRLSKSLEETLKDDAALGHFIQFMESQGSGHLVRFWLDAESFRITATTRLRSELNNAQPKGECANHAAAKRSTSKPSPTNEEEDSAFSKENRDNASYEAAMALSKASLGHEANGERIQKQTSHAKNDLASK